MLSYILQALSADRAFGPAMNKSPEIAIPVKWAVQGSMADFMVVVSARMSGIAFTHAYEGLGLVYLLDRHNTRSQPPFSRPHHLDQQHRALPQGNWRSGCYEVVAAVQGFLVAQLLAGR